MNIRVFLEKNTIERVRTIDISVWYLVNCSDSDETCRYTIYSSVMCALFMTLTTLSPEQCILRRERFLHDIVYTYLLLRDM